ncbi:MAG: FGLLP motif-containing membrane protein [Chloroflexota bacterium]
MRLAIALLVTALISSFLSPSLGFTEASLATFVGFLVALAVVLISFEIPALLEHRRVTGEFGRLRVLPWALIIAAVFVLVSRLAALQPGYLWGVVLGVAFLRTDTAADEGREQAAGALWTLIVAILAWLALGWVRGSAGAEDTFFNIAAQTALAAIVVAGLEAVAFGLMPFRFMPGVAVYRWNRVVWAVLFGASLFAFFHVLIGPTSGYLADLTAPAWLAALGVFAAFGAFTVLFWAWFRFRPMPAAE